MWTVLSRHSLPSPLGGGWALNQLEIYGGYATSPMIQARGAMTGVRNSKEFYDTEIELTF